MPYAFDGAREPTFYQHIHGKVSDAELQQLLGDVTMMVERCQPFAAVFDCRGLQTPELSQLRVLARWFADNFGATSRYHRGVACVIDTSLARGALETIVRLQRMPMPVHIVQSVDEGFEWAEHKLLASARSGRYRTLRT